jgi:hypothetical protein
MGSEWVLIIDDKLCLTDSKRGKLSKVAISYLEKHPLHNARVVKLIRPYRKGIILKDDNGIEVCYM